MYSQMIACEIFLNTMFTKNTILMSNKSMITLIALQHLIYSTGAWMIKLVMPRLQRNRR